MKEFEIDEIVYGIYGIESYITGKITKIENNKITIQCKNTLITLSFDDVYYYIPDNRKSFLCK